jgi:hypothetical protein
METLKYTAFLFIIFGQISFASISKVKTFRLGAGIRNAYVQVLHYSPRENSEKHDVIFKYADLVNRAILYKKKNKKVKVSVKVALYKIGKFIYFGIEEGTKSYGKVSSKSFSNSEKFIWTLRRAEAAGIEVQIVYHNPEDFDDDDGGIKNYLDNSMKKGKHFKRINWGIDKERKFITSKQMHNKFITVSHAIAENGTTLKNVVYTTTANIDEFDGFKPISGKNLAQTGMLIYSHPPLYKAYNNYFKLIWDNSSNYDSFVSNLKSRHRSKKLNYIDDVFSAYFYPMLTDKSNEKRGWASAYNPLVLMYYKAFKKSINTNKYFKYNTYTIKSTVEDEFTSYYNDRIDNLRDKHIANDKKLHIRSIIHTERDDGGVDLDRFDGQRSGVGNRYAQTHTKNYMFAFPYYDEFYSISGSANFKRDGFTKKANNLLMIREDNNHSIYDHFSTMFYNIYFNRFKSF